MMTPHTTRSLLSITLAALGALASATPAAAVYATGDNLRSLTHDTKLREYNLYAPASYDGLSPAPLIVDLHGASSNKDQQKGISGWNTKADALGLLVAYPQGLGDTWNAGVCCSGNTEDDVGFIRAMVDAIELEGNVDVGQVFVTGLSNGGAMTQRLACEAADVFTAAAPLAFPTPYTDFATQCLPIQPIPVLLTMGLTDSVVPYTGGFFGGAQASFQQWRTKNVCGPAPVEDHFVQGSAFCDTDTSCAGGTSIGLCSVTGVDFSPPLDVFDGHILYLNADGLVMADIIWDFFQTGTVPSNGPAVPAAGPVAATLLGLGLSGLGALRIRRRQRASAHR